MGKYNKLSAEQVQQIEEGIESGLRNTDIALQVFGRKSMESSIRRYKKNRKYLEKSMNNQQNKEVKISRDGKVKYTVPDIPTPINRSMDNSRVLIISDLHIPYNHPDSLDFLAYLADKYQPTRVICLGDELDKHAMSYHDSDPDLASAGDELKKSLPVIKQLETMFPEMDILDSNHGSLVWRKAKTHGIPKHYIKGYNDVLEVGDGWQWHNDLTIELPDGTKCYFHHGKTNNVIKLSQQMGMHAVQGHYHEAFKIDYWGNPTGLYWAMQCACLIDDKSYAFNYNNVNIKRPIIGTGLIIDSLPVLEPMVLGEDGRWIGRSK